MDRSAFIPLLAIGLCIGSSAAADGQTAAPKGQDVAHIIVTGLTRDVGFFESPALFKVGVDLRSGGRAESSVAGHAIIVEAVQDAWRPSVIVYVRPPGVADQKTPGVMNGNAFQVPVVHRKHVSASIGDPDRRVQIGGKFLKEIDVLMTAVDDSEWGADRWKVVLGSDH